MCDDQNQLVQSLKLTLLVVVVLMGVLTAVLVLMEELVVVWAEYEIPHMNIHTST